jgi:hypothetical protein
MYVNQRTIVGTNIVWAIPRTQWMSSSNISSIWSKHEIIDNLVQENLGGYDIKLKTLASKNKVGFENVYFFIK